MREDIETGYPSDYYKLKRRVSKEIAEILETWTIRASTDHPVSKEEIDTWVRELGVRSGLGRNAIKNLFLAINPKTKEWFV